MNMSCTIKQESTHSVRFMHAPSGDRSTPYSCIAYYPKVQPPDEIEKPRATSLAGQVATPLTLSTICQWEVAGCQPPNWHRNFCALSVNFDTCVKACGLDLSLDRSQPYMVLSIITFPRSELPSVSHICHLHDLMTRLLL